MGERRDEGLDEFFEVAPSLRNASPSWKGYLGLIDLATAAPTCN